MYEEIVSLFTKHQNKEIAEQQASYLKNHFVFFGIKTPERRMLVRPYLKQWRQAEGIDWQFIEKLWQNEHRECQYVALDFLQSRQKKLRFEDIERLLPLIQSKQWWDSIDSFDQLLGVIGLEDNRVDELMLVWAEDVDFWLRRIAIDHQLGRREKTNEALLANILLKNISEKEFFIKKAIGWALRDYSKTNPTWVKQFIQEHEKQMQPLSIREGMKYVPKD